LPFFAGISQYGGIGLGGIPSIQFEEWKRCAEIFVVDIANWMSK
jgi:hypothetical protein